MEVGCSKVSQPPLTGMFKSSSTTSMVAKLFDSLVTVCGVDPLEAFRLDRSAERIEHRAIIIAQEDPGFVIAGGVAGTCGSWRSRRPMRCAIKRSPRLFEPEPCEP